MVPLDEAVQLVEEQYSAQRSADELIGLGPGCADVLPAEVGALHLDDLRVQNDAQAGIDLAQCLCGGGLSGSRRADEQHVVRLVGHRQAVRQPQRPHLNLVLQLGHCLLYLGQADLVVQQRTTFGEQFRTPATVRTLGANLLGLRGGDIPFIGATVDSRLVGGDQL